mmetsp:Transcript_18146/g.39431  ORF Transcript_18146/g.39431 Transcript_18146/m.39431 type:complete len:91 (-) Transcript_18146:292-564(-)
MPPLSRYISKNPILQYKQQDSHETKSGKKSQFASRAALTFPIKPNTQRGRYTFYTGSTLTPLVDLYTFTTTNHSNGVDIFSTSDLEHPNL